MDLPLTCFMDGFSKNNVILFAFCLSSLICPIAGMSAELCSPGYYLYTPKQGPDICLPCSPGSFIPGGLHANRMCHSCSHIREPSLEIVVAPCTRVTDTVIHCVQGYYRINSSTPGVPGRCQRCLSCPSPNRPCNAYSDTICCPNHNYDIFINKYGKPVCAKLCGRGEFFDSDSEECLPCPANTYMHVDRHTHIFCQSCPVLRFEGEVVQEVCNSTHPTVIGCAPGFYKRSSATYPFSSCARCQRCSKSQTDKAYEMRACNQTHDTVCCSRPDMLVADSPNGPVCTPSMRPGEEPAGPERQIAVTLCLEGYYLYLEHNKGRATCLPCPPGTYLDENWHNRTKCENHLKVKGQESLIANVALSRGKSSPNVNSLNVLTFLLFFSYVLA